MSIKYLETATVQFLDVDVTATFPSVEAGRKVAEKYVRNRAFTKPFPAEQTYFYGPGDGTTSVVVRQDVEFRKD